MSGARRQTRAAALAALAAFVLALAALIAAGPDRPGPYRLSQREALHAAIADPSVARYLDRHPANRRLVTPLDEELQRVSFFDGPRIVVDVAITGSGEVRAVSEFASGRGAYGAPIAHHPATIALLVAVLLLLLVGLPARSPTNLDALAVAAVAIPVVLLDERLLDASLYTAYPLLAYLAGRCLWVGLGPGGEPRPRVPLYRHLARGWTADQRVRMLRLGAIAAALALAMVTISAPGVLDVGLASILGATELLDGGSPYASVGEQVLHGDTYPLLGYAAYVPGALLFPVHDAFDDLTGELLVQVLAALAAAATLWRVGARLGGPEAGAATALAWLAFPPVLIAASAGSNDIVVAAFVAALLAVAARPLAAGLAVAAGAWAKVAPLALLPPLAAALERRQLARLAAGVAAVSAAMCGWLLVLGGPGAMGDMLAGIAFQAERGSLRSLWGLLDLDWAQAIAQALVVGLVCGAAVRLRLEPRLARELPRLAGVCAAILLAVQLTASNWTYLYAIWAFPCVALALFVPAPVPGAQAPAGSGLGASRSRGRNVDHAR